MISKIPWPSAIIHQEIYHTQISRHTFTYTQTIFVESISSLGTPYIIPSDIFTLFGQSVKTMKPANIARYVVPLWCMYKGDDGIC